VRKAQDHVFWKRAGNFGAGGISRFLKVLLPALLLFLTPPLTSAQENTKNVLVLFTQYQSGHNVWLDLIESTSRARVPGVVNFFSAYLEFSRLSDEAYLRSEADILRSEYGSVKFDLVIAVSPPALQFALKHRENLFPGVPVVVTSIDPQRLEGQKLSGVTGVTTRMAVRETIELALGLHPDASNVAIITDDSNDSKIWLAIAHSDLLLHQDKVKEIDIIGPPSRQMLDKATALPSHTVVIFQLIASEYTQPAIGVNDVLEAVAQRLPTYSAWPNLAIDHGGVGGPYRDYLKEARLTGEVVGRVLNGEPADDIPIVNDSGIQVRVDWRQLHRWHIPESALPPGTVILYRPPSIWETYRGYMIVAIVVMAALLVLIMGLLWERVRRRKALARLGESEKRFRLMADTTPSLVWMCDVQGKITYLNERRLAFTGPDTKEGYGNVWAASVHPDDLNNVLDIVSEALKNHQPFSREYRLRRGDGAYRWIFDVASPRVNGDGSFGGFIGSAIDTTDQKLAQQALERVSGQLIEAQEKERSRIARELHDDICQRLALLSMELAQTNHNSSGSPEALKKSLKDMQEHCSEIAGDVQSLSHQLHSSKLDYLGIVAAIRGFCVEFSKQHQVNVEFSESNVPSNLPQDVSLSLFRVAQEALHNAVKYSGVTQFAVELSGMEDQIRLVVSDAGAGFDLAEAKKNRGLGLVSMQERINLVHGSFSIESMPWQGTKIVAAVPLIEDALETTNVKGYQETSNPFAG
jgi:PAS domain S-box-containing protein